MNSDIPSVLSTLLKVLSRADSKKLKAEIFTRNSSLDRVLSEIFEILTWFNFIGFNKISIDKS